MVEKTKVSYRRYIPGKISLVDKTPNVFNGTVEQGEDYQDLLSYVETSEYGDLLVDTIGIRSYIKNKTVNIFFDRMMLLFVSDGELYIKNKVLRKGDFYIILPNLAITLTFNDSDTKYFWCTSSDKIIIDFIKSYGYTENEVHLGHTFAFEEIKILFNDIIYSAPPNCNHKAYLTGKLIEILAYVFNETVNSTSLSNQSVRKCIEIIHARNGNVTVEELSAHVNISSRHIYSLFMKTYNISPKEYILSVRMKLADEMLIHSEKSIGEISEVLGYADYYQFTRAYKRYFNVAPLKRRRIYNETQSDI